MKRKIFTFISIIIMALTNLTAETIIPGGDVSGTWTAAGSPYLIQGDIDVPNDSTLTIEPGVDVIFQGYYRLYINPTSNFEAIGTASDSIRFIPSDTSTGWRGIFIGTNAAQHLSYCDIEYAFESGISTTLALPNLQLSHCNIVHCRAVNGGGIYFSSVIGNLTITNSTIAYNTAEDSVNGEGGGIWFRGDTLTIDSSTISANRAVVPSNDIGTWVGGGGIYLEVSVATISNSSITDNFIGLSDGGYHGHNVEKEGGAGIATGTLYQLYTLTISGCLIQGNFANAYDGGGGIFNNNSGHRTTISHCIFSENHSHNKVGDAFYSLSSADITNCTFSRNGYSSGCAVFLSGYSHAVYHVLNTIVAFNAGGIQSSLSSFDTLIIRYCDIRDSYSNMPPGFGVLDTVNHNGDTCDIYFNIFKDPMFVDTANGDLHLQAGSPCIDAGDTASPLDPDLTIADVGCYYFDQGSVGVKPPNVSTNTIIKSFILYQNYPNPFNPTTTISFSVGTYCYTSLQIYDMLGREVATLVSEKLSAGTYTRQWNAANLPSGVYFYQLKTGNYTETKKLLLLK